MRRNFAVLSFFIKDALTYRSDVIVYFIGDLLQPLLMIVTWEAIYKGVDMVGSYSRDEMIIYYVCILIFGSLISVYPHEISEDIKSGNINFFLLRPYNLLTHQFLNEIAWKSARIVYLGVSVFIIWKLFLPGVTLPTLGLVEIIELLVATMLAFFLNYYIKAIMEMFSFWLTEIEGIRMSFYAIESFFSGSILPLDLMPLWLGNLASILPFGFFYFFPTKILLHRISQDEIISKIIIEAIWTFLSIFVIRFLLKRGIKKYSAVSG